MIKTAVVILNWNGRSLLQRFLPQVVRNTSDPGCQVIVADNGSTDDSVSWLRQHHPDVKVIVLDRNYGFAEGYNRALEQVDATYYLLLNSDVAVTPGWLKPLTNFMDTHPETGACMPKIKSEQQRDAFEYAGAAGGFIDRYGYPFCRGRLFNVIEEDTGQYEQIIPVFWASGACFMVRASLYHQAGGLDTDFFAHMEEIDLSWHIQCMGYRIMVLPESTVYHVGGGSLHMQDPRKTFLNFRNNLFLLVKNLPSHLLWRVLLARMILDGLAGIKFLAGFEFRHFIAVIKAHFSFYRHFRRTIHKRKQRCTGTSLPETIYPHLLAWQFFIRKRRTYKDLQK